MGPRPPSRTAPAQGLDRRASLVPAAPELPTGRASTAGPGPTRQTNGPQPPDPRPVLAHLHLVSSSVAQTSCAAAPPPLSSLLCTRTAPPRLFPQPSLRPAQGRAAGSKGGSNSLESAPALQGTGTEAVRMRERGSAHCPARSALDLVLIVVAALLGLVFSGGGVGLGGGGTRGRVPFPAAGPNL